MDLIDIGINKGIQQEISQGNCIKKNTKKILQSKKLPCILFIAVA